jgi:hypothetical protein
MHIVRFGWVFEPRAEALINLLPMTRVLVSLYILLYEIIYYG